MADRSLHIAAMAGAGTGKTYSLVENYLYALFGLDDDQKKRPQEILALTFTQKAANEMRLRIASLLATLAAGDFIKHPVGQLLLERGPPSSDEIRRILRALPNAPIATFHGFCSQVIRSEANAIGIDANFEILSPNDEMTMARNILKPIIFTKLHSNDQAIKSLVARFRLGNGTLSLGLIDSILSVYGKLSEKGINCDDLDSLTSMQTIAFSDLAVKLQEIDQAIAEFFLTKMTPGTKDRLQQISHNFLALQHEISSRDEIKISKRFADLRQSVGGNFGDRIARKYLVSAIVKFGASLVDYFMTGDERAIAQVLKQFHQAFDQVKTETFSLSYGDLLLKTKQVLSHDLGFRRKVKQKIAHILVDEYQDTSPIQEDILALLLENRSEERAVVNKNPIMDQIDFSGGPSLFVVGDKKQSIYGFRGASAHLFDRMVRKMATTYQDSGQFSKRLLTVNRRSAKKIIDLINLVSNFTLSSQGYDDAQALEALSDETSGVSSLWIALSDGLLDRTTANLKCAAHGVVQLLLKRPDCSPGDVVVLVRRIRAASVIKDELTRFGVAARIVGGDGFFQQQEVVDLLSALKLINDPSDTLASAVVFRSPLLLLLDHEIMSIKTVTGGPLNLVSAKVLADNGGLSEASLLRLNQFLSAITKIKASILSNGLSSAIDILIDDCDLAYAIGLTDFPHQKWANIEKLRMMLGKNTKNPFTVIDEMYGRIFDAEKEPLAQGKVLDNAVTIMTIHQSKGLEFKVVVLADGEGHIPTPRDDMMADHSMGLVIKPRGRAVLACAPKDDEKSWAPMRFDVVREQKKQAEVEELARLLYVALTRAKDELYVVSSQAGFERTEDSLCLLSLFLRARHGAPEQFQRLCDMTVIEEPRKLPQVCHLEVQKTPSVYQKPPSRIRWFASELSASANSKINGFIKPCNSKPDCAIDGNLAHNLLAATLGSMTSFSLEDDHHLTRMLEAYVRAQGLKIGERATINAAKTTLKVLHRSMPNGGKVVSEKPLISLPSPEVMIEGFADLVVVAPDFIGVIEFKSSVSRVLHPNTYFQVLAYAHALSSHWLQPVKFAVMLVGAPDDLEWQDYDEHVSDVFMEEVELLRLRKF